jgi:hypothetical protein
MRNCSYIDARITIEEREEEKEKRELGLCVFLCFSIVEQ